MSRFSEMPPPVQVDYNPGYDQFGPVEVRPDGCATMLEGYGLNDEQIEDTIVRVTNRYKARPVMDPEGHGAARDDVTYSEAYSSAFTDAVVVQLNMGSVRTKPTFNMPESAMLIPGLSQRADLALMGQEGLDAEYKAARKALRRTTAIKPIAKNVGGAALGLSADVAAEVHGIIPTPAAWIAGAVIVGVSAVWATMSAKMAFCQEVRRKNAFKLWPAQKRTQARIRNYVRNPNAPLLLSKPERIRG